MGEKVEKSGIERKGMKEHYVPRLQGMQLMISLGNSLLRLCFHVGRL